MMGMISSVTATMSSPKVVLITFRCLMFFSFTHSPNADLFRSRLVATDVGSFQLGSNNLDSKSRTARDLKAKTIDSRRHQERFRLLGMNYLA